MDILEQVDKNDESLVVYITQPESLNDHSHKKGQLTFFEGGSSYLYTENSNHFVPTYHFAWVPAQTVHRFVHHKKKNICVRTFYIPEKYTQDKIFDEVGIYNSSAMMMEVFKFVPMKEIFKSEEIFDFFVSFIKLLPNLLSDKLAIYLPNSQHSTIQEVIDYILKNLSESLSLNETAENFNMGSKTFSRLFIKEVGMTFHQYVKNARIMKGIELIIEDQLSINQIAYEVGYSSIASFSNSFYSLTHKRPSEFRISPVKELRL
jgi:AraC-like DNA-binding protein